MKTFGVLFAGVLAAGLVVEGAYIVKLRRQVNALARSVDSLRDDSRATDDFRAPAAARQQQSLPAPGAPPAPAWSRPVPQPAPQPVPPMVEGGDSLPLPPALSSPEAREQLHKFVAAALTREREERREQWSSRRDEAEQRLRERITKEVGLTDDESRRVGEILGSAQNSRRELFESVRSGDKQPQDIATELSALRDKTQASLKEVVGDDRATKVQDIQRQERRTGARGAFPPGDLFGLPGGGGPR